MSGIILTQNSRALLWKKGMGARGGKTKHFLKIFSLCFFYNSFFNVHQLLTTKASPQAQSQFLRVTQIAFIESKKILT